VRFDPRPSAAHFWQLCGFEEPFPRNLESALSLALPIALVRMPHLQMGSVAAWLSKRGLPEIVANRDRQLKGCLVAHRGHGFIFVDGGLAADELRLTLAHEIAHFLQHYFLPRERAVAALGSSILAVLNGDRPPTASEKLTGVISGVALGVCTHLLDRDAGGVPPPDVMGMESQADLIAFELLAPSRVILRRTGTGSDRLRELRSAFGLTPWAATAWAAWLDAAAPHDPFMDGLRMAAKKI
jgi:hypothetical protein